VAITIMDADEYVRLQCIDNEDWFAADEVKKHALLQTAEQILLRKYNDYSVPDSAIYVYANELAIAFNDVNRHRLHGIQAYTLNGVAEVSFRDLPKTGLDALITDKVMGLISDVNPNASFSCRSLKWMVL